MPDQRDIRSMLTLSRNSIAAGSRPSCLTALIAETPAYFDSIEAGVSAINAVRQEGLEPAAIEFLDRVDRKSVV